MGMVAKKMKTITLSGYILGASREYGNIVYREHVGLYLGFGFFLRRRSWRTCEKALESRTWT